MFLLLLQFVEEEKSRLKAAKNYIVEYLENVCAHRYEKKSLKEERVVSEKKTDFLEKEEEPEIPLIKEEDEVQKRSEQEKRIRAILEEFLA